MREYPYKCDSCNTPWTVEKDMSDYKRPEPCPTCGLETTVQDYSQKSIGGFVNTETDWSGGKTVFQLGPNHPDRMVTSKRQMEKVYQKHDISLDTGHFTSKEAQVKATVPIHKRRGITPSTVTSGVKEET